MQFVIFHGSFGSPSENWFPQLKEKLEALGQHVLAAQFPVDDWDTVTKNGPNVPLKNQSLSSWLTTFKGCSFKGSEKLCFIGHSLGPVFILHIIEKFGLQLDSAIFVIPFLRALDTKVWQFNHANKSFYKTDFDFDKLKRLIPVSYVLYSPQDPYVNEVYPKEFAKKMGSSLIPVTRAGHLNSEVNLNEFPLVYELCKSRLDLSLYQRYQEHRRQLYSVDYFKGKSEEVIYLSPKEVFDEGVFKFRNLTKSGFCTLFTGTHFWDTQSIYMEEARRAARRVPISRVFVYEDPKELKRPIVTKQMEMDRKAGLRVYTCKMSDIKNSVIHPDFGIWDEEYVCIVGLDNKNRVSEIRLSSRKKDITEALKWQKEILQNARKF